MCLLVFLSSFSVLWFCFCFSASSHSTFMYLHMVITVVESRRQHKLAGSDIGSVHLQFRTFDKRMANLGPVGLGAQFPIIERRKSIIHSVRRQSNSIICAAALVSVLFHDSICTCYPCQYS